MLVELLVDFKAEEFCIFFPCALFVLLSKSISIGSASYLVPDLGKLLPLVDKVTS